MILKAKEWVDAAIAFRAFSAYEFVHILQRAGHERDVDGIGLATAP